MQVRCAPGPGAARFLTSQPAKPGPDLNAAFSLGPTNGRPAGKNAKMPRTVRRQSL